MTAVHVHDGIELAYDVTGAAGAPPLLLVHGLGGNRENWIEVVPSLESAYQVFRFDHRGHGESGRAGSAYRVEHYTSDVVDFIDRVIGAPVPLVGHSLGGLVAAYVASRHPNRVRGAFLEDPPLYLGDKAAFDTTIFAVMFPMAQQLLRDMGARGASVEELEAVLGAVPSITGDQTTAELLGPERMRRMALSWWQFDPDALTAAIDGTLFAAHDVDARIEVPVRVLRAERELGAAFFAEHEEPFRKAHPFATVDLVPGASHGIHEDHLDEFVADLRRFLADL